jgi:hypothetical protein
VVLLRTYRVRQGKRYYYVTHIRGFRRNADWQDADQILRPTRRFARRAQARGFGRSTLGERLDRAYLDRLACRTQLSHEVADEAEAGDAQVSVAALVHDGRTASKDPSKGKLRWNTFSPPRRYAKDASVAEATALIRAYAAEQARINAEMAWRLAALERRVVVEERNKATKAVGAATWAEAQRLFFNMLRP